MNGNASQMDYKILLSLDKDDQVAAIKEMLIEKVNELDNKTLIGLSVDAQIAAIGKMSSERVNNIDNETLLKLGVQPNLFCFIRVQRSAIDKMSPDRINSIDNRTLLGLNRKDLGGIYNTDGKLVGYWGEDDQVKVIEAMSPERVDDIDNATFLNLATWVKKAAMEKMSKERLNLLKQKIDSNEIPPMQQSSCCLLI